MTGTRRYLVLAMTLAAVIALVVVDSVGPLHGRARIVLDNAAQLTAGVAATLACALSARRVTGIQRAWRRLMSLGMAGWSVGQVIWSYYQVFADTPLPSPSWADVGYLTLPVFALPAVLTIAAAARRPSSVSLRHDRAVLALDGLIVVGALFLLTWVTALGAVVQAGAATDLAFAVAIAYPVTDLMLAVIVVLLIGARPAPAPYRPQLALLGLGLIGLSISDSVFAYLVASGAAQMTPLANAGFVAGPALIALAGLSTVPPAAEPGRCPKGEVAHWWHLLAPYLPVVITGSVLVGRVATGHPMGPVETYVGWLGLVLVVLRQVIVLTENAVLLARVSEGRQRLAYQAYHDSLTGLANRALFRERLVRAVGRYHAEGRPLALLFVDLDDFKVINDRLGHTIGDRALRAVAARLSACVGPADLVARLGGDEFAILLDGPDHPPERLGERVLTALAEPFTLDAHVVNLRASVGAVAPDVAESGLTADALLHRADTAMYTGKRSGKGIVVRYHPAVTEGSGDPELPNLLAAALAGDPAGAGFTVHYQPIVRLADGAIVAVEALARWSHPVAGPVGPEVFVAVAERAGLVWAVDDFVLNRACADAAALAEAYGHPIDVHVNVSAARLGRPQLESAVFAAVDRLPPGRLVLEITETSRIGNLRVAAQAAERIRARGVRLALDDFGSGFNALAQLHALPVTVVKLDGALTRVDEEAERAEALCRSVLAICAGMEINVVAEGVETTAQAAALARLGCRLGQGYLYGPPVPIEELIGRSPVSSVAPPQRSLPSTRSPAG